MDWKYKNFRGEAVFQAPRELVLEAAQASVIAATGWPIRSTASGFEASGYSAFHEATARFQIVPLSDRVKVRIELLVRRAGLGGFMLFDVGGYYNLQIRKWLQGIPSQLHNTPASSQHTQAASIAETNAPQHSPRGWNIHRRGLLEKALGMFFLTWLIIPLMFFFVLPLIGLVTGHLYVPGRSGGDLTLHGVWARTISGLILLIDVLLILKARRKFRGQEVLRTN
jgi:hypothetical protein